MGNLKNLFIYIILIFITVNSYGGQSASQRKFNNRYDVFKFVVKESKIDDYARFSFYTSRLLFVSHPEMYIKADLIYYKLFSTIKGFDQLFKHAEINYKAKLKVTKKYFKSKYGKPLNFATINLKQFRVIKDKYILKNERIAHFKYVDTRIGSLFSILKRVNKKVTSLELAFLSYFVNRAKGRKSWIIFTDNHVGYLYIKGKLFRNGIDEVASVKGNPIVIFNESNCYSPLVGRDDRNQSTKLRDIYSRLKTKRISRNNNPQEIKLINMIKDVTKISGSAEYEFCILSAGKIGSGMPFATSSLRARFKYSFKIGRLFYPLNSLVYYSNLLSPFTFFFANRIKSNLDIKKTFRLYRRLFFEEGLGMENIAKKKIPKEAQVNNCVWYVSDGYFRFDIEDNFLTKGGVCRENVLIASAILRLSNVKNYIISLRDHAGVWIPSMNIYYSNGRLFSFDDGKNYSKLVFININHNGHTHSFSRKNNNLLNLSTLNFIDVSCFISLAMRLIDKRIKFGRPRLGENTLSGSEYIKYLRTIKRKTKSYLFYLNKNN